MNSPPPDATHSYHIYGHTIFYRRVPYPHLNQVSEEWETRVRWYWWNGRAWKKEREFPKWAKPIKKEDWHDQ